MEETERESREQRGKKSQGRDPDLRLEVDRFQVVVEEGQQLLPQEEESPNQNYMRLGQKNPPRQGVQQNEGRSELQEEETNDVEQQHQLHQEEGEEVQQKQLQRREKGEGHAS